MKPKGNPEKEKDIREIGTPTADSASALEPPALTDSEYDSESDDESHYDALIFKERQFWHGDR